MEIRSATYLMSNTEVSKLPKPDKPEYAFIGRSNVGKSSLINMITGVRGLAKISGRPGKTITINHFLINEEWYLVDLPGYGFAKRSRTAREQWTLMLRKYLTRRDNLIYTFVLIDIRHEAQTIDLEFIHWLAETGLPFILLFTKHDKIGKTIADKNLASYKKELLRTWEELPLIVVTSSLSKLGRDEVLEIIDRENQSFGHYTTSTNM